MYGVMLTSGSSTLLDNSVVSFIVNGMEQVIGICTVQPLGTFITIGLVGAIVGLGLKLLKSVKRG